MTTWKRLRNLSLGDAFLLSEAGTLLLVMRVALRVLPRRLLKGLYDNERVATPTQPSRVSVSGVPAKVSWAVQVMAARFPQGMTCLYRALAAQAMLRRRGYSSVMRIGVAGRDAQGKIKAHAWVECDGGVVVGDLHDLFDYAVLSSPGAP